MSDDFTHLDLDHEDFQDAPRALLDHVRSLKRQVDAASAELSDLRGLAASQALRDPLKGFRSPAKVENQLLADGIDPLDSDAVAGWLADFGGDYAKATPEA